MQADPSPHRRIEKRWLRLIASLYLAAFGAFVAYLWVALLFYLPTVKEFLTAKDLVMGDSTYLTAAVLTAVAKPLAYTAIWFMCYALAKFQID